MTNDQPAETDLELVVSLSGDDVAAIDEALVHHLGTELQPAAQVVAAAHLSLQAAYCAVPSAFFSYRLRKLVALGKVAANGPVSRDLQYTVRLPDGDRPVA